MAGFRMLALAGALICALGFDVAAQTPCQGRHVQSHLPAVQTKGQPVADATALGAALQGARGGETFLLASGNYGTLRLNASYRSPVTIRSADPAAPACFTRLVLQGAGNVHLDGVYFDYTYNGGDPHFIAYFVLLDSTDIKISNSVFDGGTARGTGTEADGYSIGIGLKIERGGNLTLSGNEFRRWWTAVLAVQSRQLTFSGNNIHTIRSDGIDIDAADGLTIERNRFHDFGGAAGSQDHRDMIQIMRVSPRGSSDIVIRDNVFDMAGGDFTQTIWAGGDGKDLNNPVMRHRNVLVENNMIYNAHIHGISIHGSDNISIRKNSLIHVPGGHSVPAINISSDSTSVVIEQNAVASIIGYQNQRDWVVLNNALIQDQSPSQGGYYDREFIYHARGRKNGYNEYGVRPGSQLDRLNAGSTLSKSYPSR